MANNYYTHGTYPTPNSPGSSALLRNELDLIGAGFDKLPSLVIGNANKLVVVNSSGTALTVAAALGSLDVIDTGFVIQDNGDATKKARFEASGITAGATRILTLPDGDTTLVGTGVTQTLTNKTLGSGTVVTAGTIDGAVIGGSSAAAGTFTTVTASSVTVGGSAVTTASNTQTLTNKTLTAPTINNGTLVGGTADGVTIGGGSAAAGTFTTLAATSGTVGGANIVTVSASQTLTNKALTSPAITGGTLDNAVIGGVTPAAATFTSVGASSLTVGGVAATTASNTQTLTNKTISGSSNTISNIGNSSLTNSSVTIGSTSVSLGSTVTTIADLSLTSPTIASITNSGTITIPATTDTLVGRATTDTLTNKTISGSSNTFSNIPNTAITGLGTMSTQNASSVTITGGSISGITDLAVADGGTGASTATAARVNLLPSYTGNGGKVLALNAGGTDVEWSSASTGTVTSVAVSGGSTGLTTSGGPITGAGTITLAGTLAIGYGGTGATTVGGARTNLLPAYTGNAGKVLALNAGGTDIEWLSVGGTGTVTSVVAGSGLTGGTITSSGTIAIDTSVVATLTGSQTLTNKTLTAPIISTISNTGTLTLPTSSDTLVGRDTTDTLTNKTISGASNTLSNIGNSSLTNSSVTIGSTSLSLGGTASALAGLNSIALRNAGTGAFDVTVSHNGTLTAGRALTLNVNDAARSISLSGNISLAGTLTTAAAFTTSGANALTLTTTGATNVTLPTTGTLATLAGTEEFTNKTLTSATISGGTINNAVIGGSTPAAGTFTALTANGNVQLGDNTLDTLTIYPSAVTWSGTPTHSGNHTFSGDVTATAGVVRVATAAVDTNTTQAASTAYVVGQGYLKSTTAASTYLTVASPSYTGTLTGGTGVITIGTTQIVKDSSGNFALGVATPLARLHVVNSGITGGGPASSGSAADPNSQARLQAGTAALDVGAYSNGDGWLQQRSSGNYATNYGLGINPNGGRVFFGGGVQEKKGTISANAIDLSTGNYFTQTISGSTTFSITAGTTPASGTVASFILELTNGGSNVIYWTGVKWAGGSAPSLTAAGKDILGFYTHDAGTTWNGLVLGRDVK